MHLVLTVSAVSALCVTVAYCGPSRHAWQRRVCQGVLKRWQWLVAGTVPYYRGGVRACQWGGGEVDVSRAAIGFRGRLAGTPAPFGMYGGSEAGDACCLVACVTTLHAAGGQRSMIVRSDELHLLLESSFCS
jgi:hypothetical protein